MLAVSSIENVLSVSVRTLPRLPRLSNIISDIKTFLEALQFRECFA
jgi:hypothetical protein